MSSFSGVPPVDDITARFKNLASSLHTCAVCSASSRVGTSRIAWISGTAASTSSSTGMQYAAVFPVPFLARARRSRPASVAGMDSSWMGDGRSKPFSKMPIRSSRLR
eukprot:Amastigsp_a841553_853.p3 type:complete len:107 gc:universal Amastigsp_a841553_853:529-209(-)